MDIVTCDTTEQFVRTSAAWISGVITNAIDANGSASVGLSGGSTPKPVYTMLAADQQVAWQKVTFFLTDERYTPATHEDSNQHMIRSTLLTREAAHAAFLAPRTELLLPHCMQNYSEAIAPIQHPDLVILGMGDDAHIASLFPPVSPEAFGPETVIHTETDRFAVKDRISVTFPVLLRAEKRVFLITGDAKKKLLRKMQENNEDVSMYPAQYLFDERTTWIVGP